VKVTEAQLKECTEPVKPEAGGSDFIWPPTLAAHDAFSRNVATTLRSKGFCVIQMKESSTTRGKAVDAVNNRDDFVLPKEEFREAYLGRGARSGDRVLWMEAGEPVEDPVAFYQQYVMNLSFLLGGVDRSVLGFRPWEYLSGTLLRGPAEDEAIAETGPLTSEDIEDGLVQKHLDFIQRRKVCLMYFIKNQGGSVELYPREDLGMEPVSIPIAQDKLLIFRHDLMGYAYQAEGGEDLALQSWFMEEPQEIQLETLQGDQRGVENILGGPAQSPDLQCHVMVGHCRFPGGAYGKTRDWLAYLAETDTYCEVPKGRFDMSFYYAEESDQFAVQGKSVSKHCGFLQDEEWRGFDNKFFGLSENAAFLLVPCQRLCLEVAYEGFTMAGHNRKSLAGSNMYTCIADIGLDWTSMLGYDDGDHETWLECGPTQTLSCNRLAYCLDLRGPITQVDTACSASMVGSNMVHAQLRQHKEKDCHEGHCTGFQNILTPWSFIGLSGAGMVGRAGRCLTFDNSANGFARGEGCGHLFFRMSTDVQAAIDRLAVMVCGFVNQDGRSASLTAPNGPSQQAVMRSSFLDGNMVPAECIATETTAPAPRSATPLSAAPSAQSSGRVSHLNLSPSPAVSPTWATWSRPLVS
jgi:polyketide synthase-associated protein